MTSVDPEETLGDSFEWSLYSLKDLSEGPHPSDLGGWGGLEEEITNPYSPFTEFEEEVKP